jgi:hypothetical protein
MGAGQRTDRQLTVYGRSLRAKAVATGTSAEPPLEHPRRALKVVAGGKPNGDIDESAK